MASEVWPRLQRGSGLGLTPSASSSTSSSVGFFPGSSSSMAARAGGVTTASSPGNSQQTESKQAEYSLFVRYLPDDTKLEELTAAFSQFGRLLPSTRLFSMKRIGFVDFEDEESLKQAEKATVKVRNTVVACERAVAKGDPLPAAAVDKRRQIDRARGRYPRTSDLRTSDLRTSDLGLGSQRISPRVSDESEEKKTSPLSQDFASRLNPRFSFGNVVDLGSSASHRAMSIRSDFSGDDDQKQEFFTFNDDAGSESGASGTQSIYVGGVPDPLTKEDIDLWLTATLPPGISGNFRFVRSMRPGADRIGFIDFPSLSTARDALEALRGSRVKGHRLRLELAKSSPAKPKPRSSSLRMGHYVKIPHVPPGTTVQDIVEAYSRFGHIMEITLKNTDTSSGELVGDQLESVPDEPKVLMACISFDNPESAHRATMASQTIDVDFLQIVHGELNEVIVGPFLPSYTLAQITRVLSKFGKLAGARLVQKSIACAMCFDSEAGARAACEVAVTLRGVDCTAMRMQVY